jgi:hypothetical protein
MVGAAGAAAVSVFGSDLHPASATTSVAESASVAMCRMIHPLWFCKVRSAQMRSAFVFPEARLCSGKLHRSAQDIALRLATEKGGDYRMGRIIEAAR